VNVSNGHVRRGTSTSFSTGPTPFPCEHPNNTCFCSGFTSLNDGTCPETGCCRCGESVYVLFVVCCLLFVVCCWLLVVCCWLLLLCLAALPQQMHQALVGVRRMIPRPKVTMVQVTCLTLKRDLLNHIRHISKKSAARYCSRFPSLYVVFIICCVLCVVLCCVCVCVLMLFVWWDWVFTVLSARDGIWPVAIPQPAVRRSCVALTAVTVPASRAAGPRSKGTRNGRGLGRAE